MAMEKQVERLLAQVLDLFAEQFGRKAILRGGMVLRVLGSARYTNDLDYTFAPYNSKSEIVDEILDTLSRIPNAQITHSLNSQCLRVVLSVADTSIQIEAKVAKSVKSSIASTRLLSTQHDFPKRLIPIVDLSVALADTLAAWNERRLMRDIFDICFFLQMNIKPNIEVLHKRLKKPRYSRLIDDKSRYRGATLNEFYEFIRQNVSMVTDKQIQEELADYLLPDELAGLANYFRAVLVKLVAAE